jgi:hypothetical protein
VAIEVRLDATGLGTLVVACVHCSEDIADPADGVAVWTLGGEPAPVEGTVFRIDYAHNMCEERFQEGLPRPESRELAKKLNLPMAELFDMLRRPSETDREDQEGRVDAGA